MKGNECIAVQRLLALRPADWDESERRQAEAHLVTCAECSKRSRAYAAQDRALQALSTAGLDDAARQRLFARLERGKGSRAIHPRIAWVLGAAALFIAVLVITFLLWQGSWIGSVRENTPTTGPTRVLMPSPTITPTTVLTPTPVGDRGTSQTFTGEVIPYTPLACQWNVLNPGALDRAPSWPKEVIRP